MKPTCRHNYKALYHDCTAQSTDKQQLIAILQQQVTQLVGERKILSFINQEQDHLIGSQKCQLTDQQTILTLQQETINRQAEKSVQQETIIREQDALIATQQKELDKNKKELFRLDEMRHELRMLKKWMLGIRSEKRHQPADPGKPSTGDQLLLLLNADAWGVCQINGRRKIDYMRVYKTTTPKKRGGRHELPEGLEEEITIIDTDNKPPNARCVGHVDQRQLACDPMRWYIKIIRRLVYLAPVDEDHLNYKQLIAPLPPHPLPRCKVDISVLVLMLTDKYVYHLPVWRQRQRFGQYGIDLPYSTMSNLTNQTCAVLEPLWHLLLKEMIIGRYMHMDETTYRVLDTTKKKGKKSHLGWMWAMLNPLQKIVCFMYQQGRGKKDIQSVLQEYIGYLLTDGYGAYDKYGKQRGVKHLQCLTHARRYFVNALENDNRRAAYVLDHFFGPLYDIEEQCKALKLDYDQITLKRQSESVPILQAFRQWLEAELPKTLPRTPIYKAINYMLNRFEALMIYTTDGMLAIDNNQLEGQIRSIAVGRKNYLFAGSHDAGQRAAIIYSLVGTCKLHRIDPAKWLDDVLRRIPDQPEEKLIELLPQFWQPLHKVKQATA